MGKFGNIGDTELKWWEKKQGISLEYKMKKLEAKQWRKEMREKERQEGKPKGFYTKQKRAEEEALDDEDFESAGEKSGGRKTERGFRQRSERQSDSRSERRPYGERRPYNAAVFAESKQQLFDLASLDDGAKKVLEDFDDIVSSVYPLTSKQRSLLPAQIRALSHELTDEREDRHLGYMNETTALSAYIHYYLWWNIVRQTRLFANLPQSFFNETDGSVCLDVGSGPLTVPIAIFLARPELRAKKLTWYCMDISAQALQAGENIFLAVAAALKCEPWKIVRVRGTLEDVHIKQNVDFITCANVFNEIVQNRSESAEGEMLPPDYLAKKYSVQLLNFIDKKNDKARIFITEPGVPSCGRFITCIRTALMKRSFYPVAPCPHYEDCPMQGKRGGKWCNLSFSTEDAPYSLRKFSKSIYIPKERAVLSFIAAEKVWSVQGAPALADEPKAGGKLQFRITSDPIRLPGDRTGYYACSEQGLLLVVTAQKLRSGQLLEAELKEQLTHVDAKSGALVLNLKD